MSFFIGYRVPGDPRGRCLTLDDRYHGAVTDADAESIVVSLRRAINREPAPQSVRGGLIRLAKARLEQKVINKK
jgi:hypothetical protein